MDALDTGFDALREQVADELRKLAHALAVTEGERNELKARNKVLHDRNAALMTGDWVPMGTLFLGMFVGASLAAAFTWLLVR